MPVTSRASALPPGVGSRAAALVVVGYGGAHLATWPVPGGGTAVAAVQGGVPVSAQWSPERYGTNLDV